MIHAADIIVEVGIWKINPSEKMASKFNLCEGIFTRPNQIQYWADYTAGWPSGFWIADTIWLIQ